ncbi:Mor transcription activator family protein [Methylobacter tundripaludum]|uniref:Mor transcription activator family protein n=1 Tax=Methylobacter tundripaludum TaxID=173365 RepID=A0A2S6H5A2_9GAMM|nr:Mor transcription activator family protein [Methylobacter tundripaludum]PPK72662.1 Mor transcription activator family protein [Methylobacter tundripaludum]
MTGIIQEMRRVVASVVGDDQKASDVVYALITNFGGERLTMPANDYDKRNQEIKDLHDSGATVEQLARRYRLSPRTVYRILD